jgi:septum formation protein
LFLKSESALFLASTSIYRRELLARLGVPFEIAAPRVDETPLKRESPAAMVRRLARLKAQAIATLQPKAWVIGSDQAAACGRQILGKPLNKARCMEQLQACSGRRVRFLTAVALANVASGRTFETLDTTWVKFRRLDAGTIERYVEREQPFDCAGGFKSEGLGIALFESIESRDPTGLVGLPLISLCKLLRRAGFTVP